MLIRGRTVVLCVVVLELCLEYSILYEAVRYQNNPGQFTVFGANDPYIYEALLITVLLITMLLNLILFIYGLASHRRRKKKYVVFVFGFHFIIVVPFFLSGLYLYFTARTSGASKLRQDEESRFTRVLDLLSFQLLEDKAVARVLELQNEFCCCGLDGPEDWGGNFAQEDTENATVEYSNVTLSCPHTHRRSKCFKQSLEGCATRITKRKQFFIFISSTIGLACGLFALIIAPCLYASFEYDRRRARAAYIRNWRGRLEVEIENERVEDDAEDSFGHQKSCDKKEQKSAPMSSKTQETSTQGINEEQHASAGESEDGRAARITVSGRRKSRTVSSNGSPLECKTRSDAMAKKKQPSSNSMPRIIPKRPKPPKKAYLTDTGSSPSQALLDEGSSHGSGRANAEAETQYSQQQRTREAYYRRSLTNVQARSARRKTGSVLLAKCSDPSVRSVEMF